MIIREYTQNDIPDMIQIWNEVVDEGIAFRKIVGDSRECKETGRSKKK